MRRLPGILWISFFCSLLTLAFTGCSDTDVPRSVLHVVSVNQNQSLKSDVVTLQDGSLTIMEDAVPLEVTNEPHDGVLNLSGTPFGYVVLERYEVSFESTEAIPPVSGGLGWTVPAGRSTQGSVVIVPAYLKTMPPLVSLVEGGEIVATAHIRMIGHEAGSDEEIAIETVLPVQFANWAD